MLRKLITTGDNPTAVILRLVLGVVRTKTDSRAQG